MASERAILAPKNIDVHKVNNIVLTKIRDQAVLYKSADTVLEPNEAVNYPSMLLSTPAFGECTRSDIL